MEKTRVTILPEQFVCITLERTKLVALLDTYQTGSHIRRRYWSPIGSRCGPHAEAHGEGIVRPLHQS